MSLEDQLLGLLKRPEYTPMDDKAIAEALDLKWHQKVRMKSILKTLVENGKIAKIKKDLYAIPRDADLISGKMKFKANGSALLIPDTGPNERPKEPIPVRAEDTGVSLHGDHVLVRIVTEKPKPIFRRGKKINAGAPRETVGQVKQVLKRERMTVTGTLKKSKNCYYVIPDDPRIPLDVIVGKPKPNQFATPAKEGYKVIAKLYEWEHRKHNLEGEVVQVLGPTHSPSAEYEALLHKFDLDPNFPDSVMKEVDTTPSQVQPKDIENREDCRELFTLTIDPDDAKDFDDALSIERTKDGGHRLGIHIADVCHYVRSSSNLDTEAKKRGNSTYLVGTVIPMLPHALSNGICSLVEGQNRLTKAVFLTFDKNGNLKNTDFANTVICSNKRLTYHQAYAFLKQDSLAKIKKMPLPPSHQTGSIGRSLKDLEDKELKKIQSTIRIFWKIALKLRKARMKAGSLDFDMPEVKIFVDKTGRADRIENIDYDESHQLIEEFMLAANEAVAKALFKDNLPFISRVHDDPDPEKLSELREALMTYGIATGDLTNKKAVTRLLEKIKDHPQGYLLKILFLRSLRAAAYRAQCDGHYGLAKVYYTHFTSPIRRYSDLITHRIFDNYLLKHKHKTAPKKKRRIYKQKELDSLSQHISITEQKSTEAERESTKIKLLEFFEREQKKKAPSTFQAMITDVKNHGLFIELTKSMAFGFVHISTIRDDIYKLNQEGTAITGRRRGRTFQVGDKIEVIVERVDRYKRQMDFLLASEPPAPEYPKKKTRTTTKKKSPTKKATKTSETPKKTPKKKRRNR